MTGSDGLVGIDGNFKATGTDGIQGMMAWKL